MTATSKQPHYGLFKSVVLAHMILVMHVLLLAVIGLLVLFFSGVVRYMFWIFLIGVTGLVFSAYLFYRRMKRQGKTINELLRNPHLRRRSLEVGILGGLLTLKLGRPSGTDIDEGNWQQPEQLEDSDLIRVRELAALARLLEKELITPEEFDHAKQRLMENQ